MSETWRARGLPRVLAATALWLGTATTVSLTAGTLVTVGLAAPRTATAFSFREEEERDRAPAGGARSAVESSAAVDVGAACRARIASRRTVVVVAERSASGLRTDQSSYGAHVQAINRALRQLSVRTYTQEEIRAQVAQAEIDAYFRNDPDAALAASTKLGADLVVRGVISSRSAFNAFMGIPEVSVSIALTLADRSGRVVSDAVVSADSYSSYDTLGMALRLVDEEAPAVVRALVGGYCRDARVAGGPS